MAERSRELIRLLVLSASLRAGSLNTRPATATIEAHDGEVDLAWMHEFDAPSYDNDLQDREGFPAGAEKLAGALSCGTGSWSPRPSTTHRCPAC
jgi:NAD(P)H-dependent FMN reductase